MRDNLDQPRVVGLYFSRLSNADGGSERMICQLAGALAECGFCVYLITWDASEAQAFHLRCILGFRRGNFIKWVNE